MFPVARRAAVALLAFFAGVGAAAGAGWTTTGSPAVARARHTATILPDGRVLVAGGSASGVSVASVEIYDPATGTWGVAASLPSTREAHTATLLTAGKVLVAGGASNGVPLSSAALYDATNGTWSAAGALTHARAQHTATLLPDGRVLVAGGRAAASLASAEIYDPATNAWSVVEAMDIAREAHAATPLADGRVLVMGGSGDGTALASSEIFDPSDATWSPTDDLLAARSRHTATLLANGNVLVAGGRDSAPLATAELYDVANGEWTSTGVLAVAREEHTATRLGNGKVVVTGGSAPNVAAEEFDPVAGAWSATVAPAALRVEHTATLLTTGKVLIAGGASAELYHSVTATMAITTSVPEQFGDHTAVLLPNGTVLVAGGAEEGESARTTAFLFDPPTAAWSPATALLTGTCQHTATLLPNGTVLIAGGRSRASSITGGMTEVQLYDPGSGAWTRTGSLTHGRFEHSATLLPNGKVLVAGGGSAWTVRPHATAEIYEPSTGTWSATGSMSTGRQYHTATLLRDGRVLVAGGHEGGEFGQDPVYLASAEIYDPASGTWTPTGSMNSARSIHTATLLPNGRVLVTGGCVDGDDEQPNPFGSCTATTEIFDPSAGAWTPAAALPGPRGAHTATLLPSGLVVVIGGKDVDVQNSSAWLTAVYDPALNAWTSVPESNPFEDLPSDGHASVLLNDGRVLAVPGRESFRTHQRDTWIFTPDAWQGRPAVTSVNTPVVSAATITGSGFRGADAPLVQLQSIQSERITWLVADATSDVNGTLHVNVIPPELDLGWHHARVFRDGIPSDAKATEVRNCSLAIAVQPQNATTAIGARATFSVVADGARSYQWQKDGIDIPGATGGTHVTPPVVGADSGSRYRCRVTGTCSSVVSSEGVLTVADTTPPAAEVLSPSGGEYWLLSPNGGPANEQLVAWSMADDVRVCRVAVALLYSSDGGSTYVAAPAGGGLPATFGPGGTCANPGEGTTSVAYTVPSAFPSGIAGSLYKIEVTVTDHFGLSTTVRSANPFYVVQANPDSVRTIILKNTARMQALGIASASQAAALDQRLQELANHPRVQGRVVDVGSVTSIANLYMQWDADPSDPARPNAVLFAPGGIHEYLRVSLLPAYSGVRYLVLAGDDRVIPMARLQDRTLLLPETAYPAGGDLTAQGTSVGRALAAGKYLSDDPLAVLDAVDASELDGSLYLPDLAVGRLVETPQEIVTAIATYISQDGILDLTLMDPSTGRKVAVTGYDFLSSVAVQMRARWKRALGVSTPDSSSAPVDGSLIGGNWSLGSVAARATALRERLAGRYGIVSLAGHATHYEEGVPGTNPFDIQGLSTADIYGADACGTPTAGPLDLAGSVVYSVGCHGGLSVPGSCRTDANRSLDMPQTMLARGAVAYIANSGYGWGLKSGIGYGARLVQIFTEQLTSGGSLAVGDVVRQSKQRYYLETPRYDAYDEKSVMQWTLYGMPMYVVKSGIASSPAKAAAPNGETLGSVRVSRQIRPAAPLPPSLTQLNLSFDFTAPGVYDKYDSEGNVLPSGSGCPDPNGCYYTLNGLVDRGTGSSDLPIQPYLIYDSRLSGSSQHGVLWKGGTYDEETGWVPVIAQLVSNGGDGSDHGAAPRTVRIRPTSPRVVPGLDSPDCRPSDLELNSLTLTAGESAKDQEADPAYSIQRRYRSADLEVLYFNNRTTPSQNCDRTGPELSAGPHHQVSGATVSWAVSASDASGVWRVLVVYNPNTVDAQRQGRWIPLELTNDGSGTFRGSVQLTAATRLTYLIQAVDNRGNVEWLDYVSAQLPSSGIPLGLPRTIDVFVGGAIAAPAGVQATATSSTSVALTWLSVAGASRYDVYRSASGTNFVQVGSSTSTAYTDSSAAASTAYLYAVRAVGAGDDASPMSNPDLATTVMFTDPTITPSSTVVKAAHVTQLRTAVNAVRTLAGLGPYSYTTPLSAVLAVHVYELRTALDAARAILALSAPAYSDSTLTVIRAANVSELRDGVR